MNNRIKRIAVMLTVICLCMFSLLSCEKAEKENIKNHYTYQEFKDAGLNACLIGIDDIILKSGGYYTVKDFMAEYKDKFDFSHIKESEYLTGKEVITEYITYNKEPLLMIFLKISNENAASNEKTKIKDAIIKDIFFGDSIFYDVHFANDIPVDKHGMNYDEVKAYLEKNNLRKFDSKKHTDDSTNYLSSYSQDYYNYYLEGHEKDYFLCFIKADEANLYGKHPVINFIIGLPTEKNKHGLFRISKICGYSEDWKEYPF